MSRRIWECKHPQRYTDESLVDDWLKMHRTNWFENISNGFYGMENTFREIAEYWLKNGCHGPDYGNPKIAKAQWYWDEYLNIFKEPIYYDD